MSGNRYIGKYDADDVIYFNYLAQLGENDTRETIFNFPVYVGAVNLARFLALYEIYRRVIGLAGHIADIGSYKGASFLYFAKLIKLFEPYSPTEVHGFEWFKGQVPGKDDAQDQLGKYIADKGKLEKLISLQGLGDIAKLHDLDLTAELGDFVNINRHLRFKLIFLDCGIERVMSEVLWFFWPLLTVGGILILDHYNDPVSPSESSLIDQYHAKMEQIPYTRSPTAFFVKTA